MVKFDSLEVHQTTPTSAVVLWSFGLTNEDLTGIVVTVERSFAANDGFATIAEIPYPQRYHRDTTGGLQDVWRKGYYKISAEFQGQVFTAGPEFCGSTHSVISREMVRRRDIDLKFSGIPVAVYLKRKGARCTSCWDKVLKTVTSTDCQTCYGTGYLGGYYEPVLTTANIIPEQEANQPDITLRENSQTSLAMSVIPVIRPDDLIYEVNGGSRWRVTTITPVEIDRILVAQEPVVVTKLNPGDVEHNLPIPEGLDYIIRPHWHHDIKKPFDKIIHQEGEPEVEERLDLWR